MEKFSKGEELDYATKNYLSESFAGRVKLELCDGDYELATEGAEIDWIKLRSILEGLNLRSIIKRIRLNNGVFRRIFSADGNLEADDFGRFLEIFDPSCEIFANEVRIQTLYNGGFQHYLLPINGKLTVAEYFGVKE